MMDYRIKAGSIHVATEFLCRRCGMAKPIKDFMARGQTEQFRIKPTACNDCQKKRNVEYRRKPHVMARTRIGSKMNDCLKRGSEARQSKFSSLHGCSISFLKAHIESQFEKWMNWGNHGQWHIDHIIPVISFDHRRIEEIRKCWHYSNLRPINARENLVKGGRLVTCQPELLLQVI
jgi:hypothetical protein